MSNAYTLINGKVEPTYGVNKKKEPTFDCKKVMLVAGELNAECS